MRDYNTRMKKEHAKIITEELRKARSGPDHRHRYFERRKEERETRLKEKKEESAAQASNVSVSCFFIVSIVCIKGSQIAFVKVWVPLFTVRGVVSPGR